MAQQITTANQLSEHDRRIDKLEMRMDAAVKDQGAMQRDVDALTSAVFGDRSDPERRPGLVADVRQIKATTAEIDATLKRLNWLVISGFVAALLTMILKH
ncbi:MAG: hypothetical protein ACO25M_05065 [Limnohabitans sp.]